MISIEPIRTIYLKNSTSVINSIIDDPSSLPSLPLSAISDLIPNETALPPSRSLVLGEIGFNRPRIYTIVSLDERPLVTLAPDDPSRIELDNGQERETSTAMIDLRPVISPLRSDGRLGMARGFWSRRRPTGIRQSVLTGAKIASSYGDKNERGDFDKFVESVNASRRCFHTFGYENFTRE